MSLCLCLCVLTVVYLGCLSVWLWISDWAFMTLTTVGYGDINGEF